MHIQEVCKVTQEQLVLDIPAASLLGVDIIDQIKCKCSGAFTGCKAALTWVHKYDHSRSTIECVKVSVVGIERVVVPSKLPKL